MLKYPSNIIEKFLEKNYEEGLLRFIKELEIFENKAGKDFTLINN